MFSTAELEIFFAHALFILIKFSNLKKSNEIFKILQIEDGENQIMRFFSAKYINFVNETNFTSMHIIM